MRYFFDTEFIEDGKTIDLISIGIVCEDNREYYAINYDCDFSKANDWVQENVLCYLPFKPIKLKPGHGSTGDFIDTGSWRRSSSIVKDVIRFIGKDDNPEFWAYYADYDWVVFCQLFGTMMDLPKGFPMYCRDLQQEADRLGINLSDKIPQLNEHNALADALWNKKAYEYLSQQTL